MNFDELLAATDWPTLVHAYGTAAETPDHLRALAAEDPLAVEAAVKHLRGAVIHQGMPGTATAPAALAVASLLPSADASLPGDKGPVPLRAYLLTFLAGVAEAGKWDELNERLVEKAHPPGRDADVDDFALVFGDDDWIDDPDYVLMDALYARAVLGCRHVCPVLLDAALPWLEAPEASVRFAAADCAAKALRDPGLADRLPGTRAAIEAVAESAPPPERAVLVLSLGELGADTSRFLGDPDPAVRACAALAPSQAANPAATREILAALETPSAADAWLPRAPQRHGLLHFALVAAAIERTESFEELLPAALAIARGPADIYTVDRDWGVLLEAAFPPPTGDQLTAAQQAYLSALVENGSLWDPRNGNASGRFERAGLPYDRKRCRAIVTDGRVAM